MKNLYSCWKLVFASDNVFVETWRKQPVQQLQEKNLSLANNVCIKPPQA